MNSPGHEIHPRWMLAAISTALFCAQIHSALWICAAIGIAAIAAIAASLILKPRPARVD
ncbi:MAG: hypothetical protein WBM01_12080 [Mycobacterium sp.]